MVRPQLARLLVPLWLGVTLPAAAAPGAAVPTPDSPHYDLEQLYAEGRHVDGLAIAKARIAENPDDVDLYWLAARSLFEVAETYQRTDTSVDKKAMYEEMIALADQGLALDPDNAHLRFARGIGKGRLGTTRGVLSSLFMARDIEGDWLAAYDSDHRYSSLDGNEQLPCDAALTLGIFYRLVPDWWIVKVIAGTRGDLGKSVSYLEKADACSPGRIQITKELGVSRICKGQKEDDPDLVERGLADLKRGKQIQTTTASGRIDHKHLDMLLADPSLACEYSRDGQADLDRSKLPAVATE